LGAVKRADSRPDSGVGDAFERSGGDEFVRVAVNPEQIEEFDLPTRPTKKTDSRAKTFEGESVEVDAIPPARLRQMVEEYANERRAAGRPVPADVALVLI
jgi:hypothetical protein